jgi:hypothetical protein
LKSFNNLSLGLQLFCRKNQSGIIFSSSIRYLTIGSIKFDLHSLLLCIIFKVDSYRFNRASLLNAGKALVSKVKTKRFWVFSTNGVTYAIKVLKYLSLKASCFLKKISKAVIMWHYTTSILFLKTKRYHKYFTSFF